MAARKVFISVCMVVALLFHAVIVSGKKPKKQLEKLTEMVEELQEKVDSITCQANKVHFFFHGDDHEHHNHSDDDIHVDVHLHDHKHHDDHDHHSDGDEDGHVHHDHIAVCSMPTDGVVQGAIHIFQGDHAAHATFNFSLALPEGGTEHGVHVHQYGDITDGCSHIGGHYDPYDEYLDVADMGILKTESTGEINEVVPSLLTLYGRHSIIGRSIAIHDTDHSKMACCVIGWCHLNTEDDGDHTHDTVDHHHHDHGDSHGHSHSHEHKDHSHAHH